MRFPYPACCSRHGSVFGEQKHKIPCSSALYFSNLAEAALFGIHLADWGKATFCTMPFLLPTKRVQYCGELNFTFQETSKDALQRGKLDTKP